MKKNILCKILICLTLIFGSFVVTSCKNEETAELTEQQKVYNLYILNAKSNGETPLTYEQWLLTIKGDKGDIGESPVITIGSDGNWIINGNNSGVRATGVEIKGFSLKKH